MVILIYILFCLLAVLAVAPPREAAPRQILYAACGVVLFLVAALRPESSVPDYSAYLGMYEGVVRRGGVSFIVEPGFSVIALLVDRVFGEPLFLFVIYAALGVWLKMTAIKRLGELWFLSLVLYFATFFLQHEMVQIRAGIATGFILMALKPMYERKPGPFLGLMTGAVLFHYSALAALPLWFLPRRRRFGWFLWGIVPVGCAIYFAGANLLDFVFPFPVIQARLQDNMAAQASGVFDSVAVFGPAFFIRIVLYYLLLAFHSKLSLHNPRVTMLLYIYAIGLFIVPAFGTVPVISARLSDIFIVVEIVLVPMVVYAISPRRAGRSVVVAVALCHLLLALAFGSRLVV